VPTSIIRQLKPADIVCPAGLQVGDAGCVCRIEGSHIDGRTSPSTIEQFCAGNHQECPTWRADKETTWKTGHRLKLAPTDRPISVRDNFG
jgi:hypothetical protein